MTEEARPDEESKIHIDTGWKERARKERDLAGEMADVEAAAGEKDRPPLPEATLSTHVAQLATQAALALGDIEPGGGKPAEPDLELAGFLIDTLAMLEDKTKGNRREDESRILEEALYGLRLRFVERTRSARRG
ncbi:MAG: DUF1844 domain-containing protein [Planctomycetes bacterium]|nr:DUF1844 domain-containing protein [Planctomycetota bacterium]